MLKLKANAMLVAVEYLARSCSSERLRGVLCVEPVGLKLSLGGVCLHWVKLTFMFGFNNRLSADC